MGLFEWLWVEVIHPTKSQLLCKVESAYYQVFEDYTDGDAICCGWPGLIHDFPGSEIRVYVTTRLYPISRAMRAQAP